MKLQFAALLFAWIAAAAEAPEAHSPARWQKDITAFEAADRESPPRPGGVVFVGSSSIRLWKTLAEDFPGVPVVNRGFGGSRVADCTHYFDRLVGVHRPRLVVFYCGGNDLADGRTPEEVAADFRQFCARLHAALPDAKLVVNSIKITPSRWKLREPIAFANTLLAAHCAGDPRRTFVDLTPAVLAPDGTPREELYVEDRLHLNAAGYAAWRERLVPLVK
jgi:lysophospholipase L1-like esterase